MNTEIVFICDECKFTREPHEHRCLDPEKCQCERCLEIKAYAASLRYKIPDWIIEYDKNNYTSSAGKAIRELIGIIDKLKSEKFTITRKQ